MTWTDPATGIAYPYDPQGLTKELKAAGVIFDSVNANGDIYPPPTGTNLTAANTVKDAHIPDKYQTLLANILAMFDDVDWADELNDIQTGLNVVANLRTDIATLQALPSGTLPNSIKTPLVGALTKIANIFDGGGGVNDEGTIHKIKKMGKWWKQLSQLMGLTADSTTTNGS